MVKSFNRIEGCPPFGSSVTIAQMLQFAVRHHIVPQVEHVPMSKVNEAIEHFRAGKTRYRLFLKTGRASRTRVG